MKGTDRDERDFREAARLHQTGDLAGAISAYGKLLKRFPKHPNLLNLQGLAQFQAGQNEAAAETLAKALAADPRIPDIHFNLATVLYRLKRFEEAFPYFEKAVAQKPKDADARNNLGSVLKALGRHDEAIAQFRESIALDSNHAGAHVNLGNALGAQGDAASAHMHLERAIALQPGNPEARVSLGKAMLDAKRNEEALAHFEKAIAIQRDAADPYFFRGMALAALKRHDEAAGNFLRATQLKTDFAEAFLELGNALIQMRRYEEALGAYQSAVAIKPDYVQAYANIGNALQSLERFPESIEPSRKALEFDPAFAQAITNLAAVAMFEQKYEEAEKLFLSSLQVEPERTTTLMAYASMLAETDRQEEALNYLRRAIARDPDSEATRSWNMGYYCLQLSQWDPGWKLHEYRFERYKGDVKLIQYRDYSAPRWNGESLSGTLLVWGEQGLGDQIIWSSLLPEARARAGKLIVECEPRLVPLFARSFDADVVPMNDETLFAGKIDVHTPIASLGKFLRADASMFSKPERGYLRADETQTGNLRARISEGGRKAVGLSWKSNNPFFGQAKTAQLRDFESIFRITGCNFIDLQYGDTSEERAAVREELGIEVSPVPGIDNTNDIDGLAALISACDAVVTTSNTTAHLAGALGKQTFVILPATRGRLWYWLKDRVDSPWYPNVTLIRQGRDEPWASVAARASEALRNALDRA